MKKCRWLAILLAVVMVIGIMPSQAYALAGDKLGKNTVKDPAMEVTITAAEGVLPENVMITSSKVVDPALSKARDKIDEKLGYAVKDIEAVYPRMRAAQKNDKGLTILADAEPNGPVEVTLSSENVKKFGDLKVFKVDKDSYAAEEIDAKDLTIDAKKGTVTFTDENFGGLYAIVDAPAPAEEPADDPAGEQPGEEPGEQTGEEPGEEPGEQTGEEPGEDPGAQPGEEPADDQPGEQPAEDQPGEQPGEDQPGEQPAEDQPGENPSEQPKEDKSFHFEKDLGSIKVTIDDPKNVLPKGTTVEVKVLSEVELANARKTIEKQLGVSYDKLQAVDIKFFDADGNEFEPGSDIDIVLESSFIRDAKSPTIVHIHENRSGAKGGDSQQTTGSVKVRTIDAKKNGSKISFKSDKFSVYVVVDEGQTGDYARLTVNFHMADGSVVSMKVKKADLGDQFNVALYDPGVGTLQSTQVFRGWTTNQNYTVADIERGLNIDGVRTAVQGMLNEGVQEGQAIDYYAMIYNVYNVTYKAKESVVLGTDPVYSVPGSGPVDYKIYMSYTPETSDQDFKGWYIAPPTNATLKDGTAISADTPYPNNTEIKLSGSVQLTVDAPKGYWLIFKENGKNVSYTSPQFLELGQTTTEPADPQRAGYSFDGWYYFEEGVTVPDPDPNTRTIDLTNATEFTFGNTLSKSTTLYAKWNC